MAYYGYSRYRSGRRSYRRGYRRYRRYGSSVRRYRSMQMNDDETKVMTFSSVRNVQFNISTSDDSADSVNSPLALFTGSTNNLVGPAAGRLYFAGWLFDRLRFRSVSVTIRPQVMPSAIGVPNYSLYAAWDRYGGAPSQVPVSYSIQTDPSSKQVVWTPGGSGTPLRTWIYATNKDRYQYLPIVHNTAAGSWSLSSTLNGPTAASPVSPFFPVLLLTLVTGTPSADLTVRVTVHVRATIEFQGGFSITSLNFSSASSAALKDARLLSDGEVYVPMSSTGGIRIEPPPEGRSVKLFDRFKEILSEVPAEQDPLAE